ncbi:MAG: hypothetical protein JNM44_13365, partial [Chitinophagaceae bacterium]|nr:hypothetical protein [Chitinophagaceae bacterium]
QLHQTIASAGGLATSSGIQLSYTVGQPLTSTLVNGASMLTQGFQQPFQLKLNLKAFHEGYYTGGSGMGPVLLNQSVSLDPQITDSILIELHAGNSPYSLVWSGKTIINTNGQAWVSGFGLPSSPVYIVIKHRNSIETWSANPVAIQEMTSYDFSVAATQVYGGNQHEVESGIFAFLTGDMNQDGVVDGLDYNDWEIDNNNFGSGYLSTDLNGDGIVDGLDFLLWEVNNNNFAGVLQP